MDRDGQIPPRPVERLGQREREADIREVRADQREREADQRETRADQREALADQRERGADQREREADQREREADQRETLADQRDRGADEREEQIKTLIGELRGLVTGAHRDALEAIERSQTLLLASVESLERTKEAVEREDARRGREQAAIARAAAYSERQLAHPSLAGEESAEHTKAMRTRLAATAAAFAAVEESAGRLFDELATSHPERASAYQHKAQEARGAAHRAREISRELNDQQT
jgi:hypothetical protein